MLEKLDLTPSLTKRKYRRQLPGLQRRLHELQHLCWESKLSPVLVFEGWDAAGKGSMIRKLTERLEPRRFELHLIREPRTYERLMPWLWRYWVKVPTYGTFGIFDRSWYGRVLVQRVEGIHRPADWSTDFREINTFERLLADDRYLLCKFFLHISRDEQRRRFEALEADPATSWQVDPEDWEHHERYDEYLTAIEEMLEVTETEWAPWSILAATDRYWTRIRVFETVIDRLERTLVARGHKLPTESDEPADAGLEEDDE